MSTTASPEVQEITDLVRTICQQGSSPTMRKSAERRLMQLQRDAAKWRFHLDLLFHLDDNCVFFVSQGLQHFAWAHWRLLSAEDKEHLTSAVARVIAGRGGGMSQYARSKVEQVLAAACALSVSLTPVFALVVGPGQPGVEVGISALKTVLEEALSDDSRLTPDHRQALVREVQKVAAESVSLACAICAEFLNSGAPDGPLLALALDVLRIIISRLPVGSHLSPQVLDVLCSLAERGIAMPTSSAANFNGNDSFKCAKHCRSAILSINILTELMGKRYIPRNETTGADSGVDLLVTLVAKVVGLLQCYKAVCNHTDNADVMLPLLEFIRTFTECHLERCLSSSAPNATMQAVVLTFLDEFATITRSFSDVELLLNAALLWKELLSVPPIRGIVLASDTSVDVAMYLLRNSLINGNDVLQLQCMDIVDEIDLNPIADRDIRELVMGISSGVAFSRGVEGTEEASCHGSSLLTLTGILVGEFTESEKFLVELRKLVPSLIEEQFNNLMRDVARNCCTEILSGHALDVIYLSRLLPMCESIESTVQKLTLMLSHLVESKPCLGGRAVVGLVLKVCQLLGGICYSCRKGGSYEHDHSLQFANFSAVTPVMRCVLTSVNCSTGQAAAPLSSSVQVACCVVLLQCVVGLSPSFMRESIQVEGCDVLLGSHVLNTAQLILNGYVDISLEVSTLLYCTVSRISDDVPKAMVQEMKNMAAAVLSSDGSVQSMSCWSEQQQAYLARTCAALGAMTKQHMGGAPAARTMLLGAFEGLERMIPVLATAALRTINEVIIVGTGIVDTTEISLLLKRTCAALSQLLHLEINLIQTFGRKIFGSPAFEILKSSSELFVRPDGSGKALDAALIAIPSGEGVLFMKELIRLIIALGKSSSAGVGSATRELDVSHELLLVMVGELSNSVVCSELLAEIINAGWTLLSCHWPKQVRQAIGIQPEVPSHETVVPLIETLVRLFVGCLSGSGIPPHDAALSIEGLLQANETFNLFAAPWFQSQFLHPILESTIKANLSELLPGHDDILEHLLEKICSGAGVAVWPVFKEISGNIATSACCNPSVVTELICEEERNAMMRAGAERGISSTRSEQTDKGTRSVFSGMKAVLVSLSSEMLRCKEPLNFS